MISSFDIGILMSDINSTLLSLAVVWYSFDKTACCGFHSLFEFDLEIDTDINEMKGALVTKGLNAKSV